MALRNFSSGTLDHIYRDADDSNKMTVIMRWSSLADARKWFNLPQVKAMMEKEASQGSIEYVEEVKTSTSKP